MTTLLEIKEKMLKELPPSEDANYLREKLSEIGKNPKRPLGKLNPWAYWIELTRGCNLSCAFCPVRTFQKEEGYNFMSRDTWINLLKVMQEVTPRIRIEFGNGGEPTMHPQILEFLSLAREIVPKIQLSTYTNGVKLIKGELTYKQLFDAGLNGAFVDMYSPLAKHQKLAEESGYEWAYRGDKTRKRDTSKFIFNYVADRYPDKRTIWLVDNPGNWEEDRIKKKKRHTWLNSLDWKAAEKIGLKPTRPEDVPQRRCDIPSRFISVNWDGTFLFCCHDMMRKSVKNFGNINNGITDFMDFWVGKYMQETRKLLHFKNRAGHDLCSKCSFTRNRGDIPPYPEEFYNHYYEKGKWSAVDVKVEKPFVKEPEPVLFNIGE